MLLLSIAYSANIGGTATMTGSTPNLALIGLMGDENPAGIYANKEK